MNQNDPNSMYHIGFVYEEEDPIKSLYYYKQAADQNYVYAQLQHAFNKLQNDKEESLRYYKMVSKQGESDSQLSLAKLMSKTDPDKSLALYKKAAEKGNIEAQEFLAIKFSKENDMENFDKYCKMLIKNGNSKVPLEFAVNLYKSKKFKLSFYYFSLLCNINHPIARYFIGVMKFYGQGCVQDKNESLNILNELSKQGIEKATNFIEDHFN